MTIMAFAARNTRPSLRGCEPQDNHGLCSHRRRPCRRWLRRLRGLRELRRLRRLRRHGGCEGCEGRENCAGGGSYSRSQAWPRRATTDPAVAAKLYAERLQELERKRKNRHLHGIEKEDDLSHYAERHLLLKAREGDVTDSWLAQEERHLGDAVRFFGAGTDLAAIGPEECTRWVDELRRQPNGRGGTLSDSSVRKRLNSLSNLYRRAVSEGYVRRNPVEDMYSKPTETRREAEYLEPEEAALLLESARTYDAGGEPRGYTWIYPLLATYLLTGVGGPGP